MNKVAESKKISVIIPVFNAEKTLAKCIDSILQQELADLEIILVDDGSEDSSLAICNEYAGYCENIKVYSQINAGPSAARNKGLRFSSGDFVSFIDSDDYIRSNMYNEMLNAINKYGSDICCCGLTRETGNKKEIYQITDQQKEVSPSEYLHDMLLTPLGGYSCNRLYRKEILEDAYFDTKYSFAEDLLFNCKIWRNVTSVCYIESCPYVYIDRDDSLSRKSDVYVINGKWAFSEIAPELVHVLPKTTTIDDLLSCREVQHSLDGIRLLSGKKEFDFIRKELIRVAKEKMDSYFKVEKSHLKKLLALVTVYFPEPVITYLMKAWNYVYDKQSLIGLNK